MSDVKYDEKLDLEVKNLLEQHPLAAGKILTSKKMKYLLDYVMACTPLYDQTYNLKTRMVAVKFHRIDEPRCIQCNRVLDFHDVKHADSETFEGAFNRFCSPSCEMENSDVKLKQNQTNQQRYWCDWTFQSENNIQKSRITMNARYGVDYAQQNESIHEKSDQTRELRYGNKNILASEYGNKKLRNTTTTRFFEHNLAENQFVIPLFGLEEFKQHGKDSPHLYKWKCLECGNEFEAKLWTSWYKQGCVKSYARCPFCYPEMEGRSAEEIGFLHELQRLSRYPVLSNVRILADEDADKRTNKEIDAYISELELGFEYDGIFYHSLERSRLDPTDQKNLLGYHLRKTKLAEQAGIKLVHIRSDRWVQDHEFLMQLMSEMLNGTVDPENYLESRDGVPCLDRSLFNTQWTLPNYHLIGETDPEVEEVKCKSQTYHCENCGYLIFQHN